MQHLSGNPMPPHCAHLATQPVAACFGAAVVVVVVVVAVVVVLLVAVVVVVVVGAAAVVVVVVVAAACWGFGFAATFFAASCFATFLGAWSVLAAHGALDKSLKHFSPAATHCASLVHVVPHLLLAAAQLLPQRMEEATGFLGATTFFGAGCGLATTFFWTPLEVHAAFLGCGQVLKQFVSSTVSELSRVSVNETGMLPLVPFKEDHHVALFTLRCNMMGLSLPILMLARATGRFRPEKIIFIQSSWPPITIAVGVSLVSQSTGSYVMSILPVLQPEISLNTVS